MSTKKIILIVEILLILIIAILLGYFINKSEKESVGQIINVTKLNFDTQVLKSKKPVLLEVYTDWCGDCIAVAPAVEEIAKEYKDIKVVKVNAETEKDLISKYEITVVPTFILIKDGEEIDRLEECTDKNEIIDLINKGI